jgi:signal transduction histidine kinase
MRLNSFINNHLTEILTEWESFAQTQSPAADTMPLLALRDHAREIFLAIALDLERQQNPAEQQQKSHGHSQNEHSVLSAASVHGALRQASDFSLLQLSAEFRALRASVLRLWLPHVNQMSASTVDEMVRFNEAIDQALAESIITYSARADETRELFLAILGHDLRAPISTMTLAGDLLTRGELTIERATQVGTRVKRSAGIMKAMVNDLLGYTRTQLGNGLPVTLASTNLREVCQGAVDDASASHSNTQFIYDADHEISGQFDGVRLHQLLTNVLVNAAQYGEAGRPVWLKAEEIEGTLAIDVTNHGTVIPESEWQAIFKPLVQLAESEDSDTRPKTSLGLGLFVAKEIAASHGGTITVTSHADAGTIFKIRMPLSTAE